nr:MAG TPA: nuclease [Caudoviricetes sp.]
MAISDYKFEYSSSGKKNAPMDGISSKKTSRSNSSAGGNLAYIGGNTAAGFGGVFEGIGRLASSTVAKLAGDDRLARYYAKKSYIGEWQSDMAEKYSPGKVTQFFADAGAGVGQSSVFLLNLVAPGAGTVIFGAGVFGNSVGEAVNKTGQLGFKEYAYGGLSAGGELLMEKISGATFKAVGRIGAGVTGSLTKNAVETTATQTAKKGFLKAVASNAVLKDLLKESSGEFVEEFLGDFWDVGISRLTGVDPEASTTLGQAVYSGMVGFASGGLMSGSSMIINRAAAASRGYHINESGNAQQMVRTAEVVLEEAKTAENFQDPAGVVDMLKESVENYNAQKDKTNFASRVALGQMQMFTAYIEKNIGVMQAYTNIMKADAQTLEQYASLASYYTKEKVTAKDLLANRDNIAMQMAIRDWVNGVLTVDLDHVAEAETQEFIRTAEGGNATEGAGETRFSMTGEAAKQALKNQLDRNATAAQEAQRTAQATEIAQTAFDDSKRVQNVRVAENMYLSIKKNSDGTYNYAINDTSAKQDANGGVWDKTNVPAEEMRQYFEQAKEGATQYEAQKAAQTAQETQANTDGKTTAEGEKAAQEQESTEEKANEKPRQKSEIDSATEQKLNKMVKGFNTMAYRDRVAVSRMVKSAEANGVDAKTVKKIAIAMTARSGLDIRFTKSISQNGTWTVFKDGSQRRLILLNPDIQSPLEQTFLHEFMHDMMHDQYTNMKAVMDVTSGMLEKGAFDDYIKERRDEYFDACAKAGREGLILTKNEDGTVTRSFASEKAEKAFDLMMREEATANFGAEFLYRRGFLTRIARSNQKLVLRTFRTIGRWINDVRSRDMETARSLEGYLLTIEDAVRNSKGNSEIASLLFGSNPAAQNAETKSAGKGEETRFELKIGSQTTPVKVQETKNLIAIHNLTEQNLLDTLNLGGFPMPSIAVVKADQGHSEYGDISVIFGKETIDPQINSKNAIYGGDAWTPTYPTIEYKVAEKVADRIRNKYYDLARKFGYDDVRPLYKYANDLEDTLNKAKGEAELISSLVDDEDMMRVFLMDSGKGKIPTVQTEVRTEMSPAEVERAKFFINALGEDVVRGIKTPEGERIGFYRQKYLDEHSDAIRNAYHELLTKEYGATEEEARRVLENAKRYDLFRIVNDAYHYLENGGVTVRTETDSAASSKAVRDAVDTKQYRTWLKDIFGGIEEKSGIRNERDPFDSRGNRRKWETLHWENTLENVVQAMLEQPDVGKGTIFSATSIWGVSAKEYKTIADMKKDTARLKTMSQQQYDTIRAGFEERLTAIADSIRDVKADNEFIARDNAISAIVEAVRTKKTGSSMLAYLKDYSNRATAQTVKDIISLVRDISDMPTQYFEAKPKRAVDFSEIKMVELPESASDTLKKQLERRKIPYEVYGKTDEDRATAVKKLNDVRFELDSGAGYSRGQMSKIVANRTKGKVYSQTDAAIAIDNVTALVSEILSDDKASMRAKIRGKSRMEVIDFLFEQMNKEQGDGRLKTALQAAEYILNHAVVQEELDSVGREEYARMVDIINGVESYRKKVKFTETEKADLKHMFDKGYPSLLRAWSSEDGMMPSRILAELKESGVAVDSTSDVESDIFADLISQYQNAKQAVKQWNESVLLNTVGDKRMLTKLKSDMAHEILKAFETTGEKSTYRKEVEARQAYISKFLEDHRTKLNAARKRAMSESRLYRNAIKLDEQLKRDRRSSQLLSDDRMRKIAESAAKIGKPRNARNPLTVRDWAKSMQEIYSPKNPLLAIYGEADEKTGIFEHTYYSNEVGEALNRLTQIDTGKKFLTDEQIVDLDTVVSGITRLYRDYDTVYFQGKRQSLTETAQRGVDNMQWIADERAKKGQRLKIIDKFKRWTDAYLYEIASPMAVIHDMERHDPNGVLSAAFEEVVYGQIGAQTMFANLMDPFETFYKENKGYKKALARETLNFQGHELTKAQAISLYCTMKREHARLGLETFGIVFDDKDGNRVKTGALKGYDAKTLYNSFNETDKRFISLVENFFNDVSKKVKGDADMRILGSTNVLDDYYFPIQRDRSQRTNSVGDTRRGISDFLETVLNLSFNQNTVRHADGRIEISDVTNTIMKHAQGLAIYANLYEQIQTFDRILNKKVGEMDADGKLIRETTKSLGEMMEDNHKGMLNYLSKLLADVQGVRTDMTGPMAVMDHALTKVYGLYAQAAISGNIKTAILPLASYFATGLYVDARHMAKGFAMNASPAEIRANMEQMNKYSSVTKGRYYDRGAIKSQTVQDEVRGLISVTGKGIEATERFMLSKVWNACKSQTAEQLGLAIDSDENCRAAAKLFDKVVIETQSQYVASMKSAMGRSKNQLVRGLTMFKSDGAAMFSSSFDAIRRFMDLRDRAKSGQDVGKELAVAKKRAGRAVASVASVCVAVAIITQAMRYAFNNDDEEEETPAKNIAMNTMNSAMGMFPLIGDVYGVFAQGYDISNMTLDALNDGINGVRGMVSLFGDKNATQADVARATRKALYGVGHMAGVPVRNLTNLTTGVIRRISKPAMYGYDSIFSGEKYSEDLQRAVKRGDDKMAEAITKVLFRRKKTGAYNQETLDEVLRLYKAGYDKKVMPGGIPDGLTRAQRKTFLNVYGKSDADVQKLIESDAYKSFDDEQKASAINSLYRSWRAYAEYQATGETDDKSALLSEIMGADKFGKARAYLSGLKAKENAETPKDGWRSTIQKGLKGMGLTSDEQALMLYAAGYHSTSDLSAFLRVLNARNLTKEQLALFSAIFKLDVKNGKLVERKTTKKTA